MLCFRKSEGSHEGGQNGLGKSVFGRLFKDFRSGQSREPKPQRPLGRTLSANFKDKERKTKLSRTLSASQKDRKIVERRTGVEESQDWEAKAFHVRNYKSFNGDGLTNGYPDDSWLTDAKSRKTSLSNPSPESCRTNNVNDSEINHSALVSYLDEEGLKKTTKQQKKHGGIR
ncbi:hypothetical protein RUM43_002939 [Polyplax serrata]|uniref:Uncharacterized protein n=1 Tax=Polyplax serrata TaxID=468196 RepID=A0AAN8S592_POLSC